MARSNNWALVDLSGLLGNQLQVGGRITGAELWVIVNGQQIPVAQFSMTYGLNDIPTASAQVALGRDAKTGQQSAIYSQIAAIKQMTEVEVRVVGTLGDFTASGTGGARKQFPTTNAVIFMGYVSGVTYRRSAGRVTMIINMVNQLFDLSASSGGSKDVVPGAPHDFMQQTLGDGPGGEHYGDAATKFIDTLPPKLDEDYSEAVLECLDFISKNNFLQTNQGDLWCGGPDLIDPEREMNLRASDVINPKGEWQGIATFSNSAYMGKYTVQYPLLVNSSAKDKAALTISNQISASLASSSMWGLLIGSILPAFGCGIVPMARGAILAPILPMAKQHQIVIKPEDYADFNMSTQSQRPLYGVGVLGNFVLGTMNPDDPKMCVGASFIAKSNANIPFNDGMWMFVPAPKWLEGFIDFDPKAREGDADVNKLMGDVSHDAVGVDEVAVERDPGTEIDEWNSELKKYAQMMYAAQALRGREGTLMGKLRFDIAPGTTIKIQSKGEELSDGTDTLATDMYAFVARVTIMINAEQASAATTLELTNLRTAEENDANSGGDDGRFAFNKHPFFGDDYFKYAPIVPELSLEPEL